MLKAQRVAHVALATALDVVTIVVAFLAAWVLRDSFGNFLVLAGDLFGYNVKGMVRHTSEFYSILLSGHPLVDIKPHLWLLLIAIPGWLFFLNVQRGYDVAAQRTP